MAGFNPTQMRDSDGQWASSSGKKKRRTLGQTAADYSRRKVIGSAEAAGVGYAAYKIYRRHGPSAFAMHEGLKDVHRALKGKK